jgi:hypothetical protein
VGIIAEGYGKFKYFLSPKKNPPVSCIGL